MATRRDTIAFAVVLAALLGALLGKSLFGGKILSSADVLFATSSFRELKGQGYEPLNRLMIDPVLQFQPWLELNRKAFRSGRLPLWNDLAGCGAPHLANAQSAPFDVFHTIAYVGEIPDVYAWMAFARLWTAGFGAYLLSSYWGIGRWGRWFSGLCFPLTGFLVVWLSFPVTSVAVWLPWLFLAIDRCIAFADPRRAGQLALVVGLTILGGHIQTSAHVLLAGGLFAVWRLRELQLKLWNRRLVTSLIGLGMGLGIGALTIFPLWQYLGKSPVWEARRDEFKSPFRLDHPRWLDTVCVAVPYAFGSQRRGHPNLAKALGVHNLNESAGGFAGLATLVWLAPSALRRSRRVPVVWFLGGLTAFGFLAGFSFTPFSNLPRLFPILDVTDHRRLSLWVAFGLSMLGGIGIDQLRRRRLRRFDRLWLSLGVVAATCCLILAFALPMAEARLKARSLQHYLNAQQQSEGASLSEYRERADRQVRNTLAFVPRQLTWTAMELLGLIGLVWLLQTRRKALPIVRASLLGITLLEMFSFAYDMNPSIDPAESRPISPLIAYLKDSIGTRGRILGIGEELAPNTLMRYGLADIRNYDSVELSRNLESYPRLYSNDSRSRTSRSSIGWDGVLASKAELEAGGVLAVVSASPPPSDSLLKAFPVGQVWVTGLNGCPLVETSIKSGPIDVLNDRDQINIGVNTSEINSLIVRTTNDSGWKLTIDGKPADIKVHDHQFMSSPLPIGRHKIAFCYRPIEVAISLLTSIAALTISLTCLMVRADFSAKGLDDLESSR